MLFILHRDLGIEEDFLKEHSGHECVDDVCNVAESCGCGNDPACTLSMIHILWLTPNLCDKHWPLKNPLFIVRSTITFRDWLWGIYLKIREFASHLGQYSSHQSWVAPAQKYISYACFTLAYWQTLFVSKSYKARGPKKLVALYNVTWPTQHNWPVHFTACESTPGPIGHWKAKRYSTCDYPPDPFWGIF